jgi:hypothetical protein
VGDRSVDTTVETNEDGFVGSDSDDSNGNDETTVEGERGFSGEHREEFLLVGDDERFATFLERRFHLVSNLVEGESFRCLKYLRELIGEVIESEVVELVDIVIEEIGDSFRRCHVDQILLVVLHRVGGHLPCDVVIFRVDTGVVENIGISFFFRIATEVGSEVVLSNPEERSSVDEHFGSEETVR